MKGWEKLIRPLLNVIEAHGTIHQYKEKFGEFRCYWTPNDTVPNDMYEVLNHAVDAVSRQSKKTCIECGKNARLHFDGWIRPLCKEHSTSNEDWNLLLRTEGWETDQYFIGDNNDNS